MFGPIRRLESGHVAPSHERSVSGPALVEDGVSTVGRICALKIRRNFKLVFV